MASCSLRVVASYIVDMIPIGLNYKFYAEVRAAESAKIREKHPDRVPVSCTLTLTLIHLCKCVE